MEKKEEWLALYRWLGKGCPGNHRHLFQEICDDGFECLICSMPFRTTDINREAQKSKVWIGVKYSSVYFIAICDDQSKKGNLFPLPPSYSQDDAIITKCKTMNLDEAKKWLLTSPGYTELAGIWEIN